MKKVVIGILVFCFIIIAQISGAADISATFAWQQGLTQPVASWDVFMASASSGPWTLVKNQPYYALSGGATEYFTTATLVIPNNAVTTLYFKAQTIGTSGLRSVDSNIATKTYDTRVAPDAPGSFNVK